MAILTPNFRPFSARNFAIVSWLEILSYSHVIPLFPTGISVAFRTCVNIFDQLMGSGDVSQNVQKMLF